MKRNEYPLRWVARDGTVNVWLYDIQRESDAGRLTWNVRAWPRDAEFTDGGGEWYGVGLQEIDFESVRIVIANNHLPAQYQGRGVAIALYPILARRLGRRLLSSRTAVTDTNEWRTPRATEIWRHLVGAGEAEEIVGADSFVIEGRPGRARRTAAKPAPEWPSPPNALEFESLMTEVDRRLQAAGIPIVGHVITGVREVSKILAAELELTASRREPIPDVYEGDDLVIRISRWFDARYGERQNLYLATKRDQREEQTEPAMVENIKFPPNRCFIWGIPVKGSSLRLLDSSGRTHHRAHDTFMIKDGASVIYRFAGLLHISTNWG